MYTARTYRNFKPDEKLIPFQVTIKETDLYIKADSRLEKEALSAIATYRAQIENYIGAHPLFAKSFVPLPHDELAPPVVKEMLQASARAGVGPMAAVAGAIAEFVGKSLLTYSSEVIVENGGDIFVSVSEPIVSEIFAGTSALSQKIGVKILPGETPIGICTSSGTVGPSVSFGKADAVTIVSPSTALADAVATAVGNVVKTEADIAKGINLVEVISGVKGAVIILGDNLGVWGDLELVKL